MVNTMAFSGYPGGRGALTKMARVLKIGGRLVMMDINYPRDRYWLGMLHSRFWMASGDIIRDMDKLFAEYEWAYEEREVGGFGSGHLYVAQKQ